MAKVRSFAFYVVLGILVVVFLPPFAKYQELRYKNRKLEEKIKTLSAESRRLEAEKKRLETDITYIEKKARDKIGLVRKGEIILRGSGEETGRK